MDHRQGFKHYPPAQRREAQRFINMGMMPAGVARSLNEIAQHNPSLKWSPLTRKLAGNWKDHGTGWPDPESIRAVGMAIGNKHLVFVYGTLKRGERNAHYLSRGSVFWGHGTTIRHYTMADNGYFPEVGDPREAGAPREGAQDAAKLAAPVRGEVYLVNDATLHNLDGLEGVDIYAPKDGHYRRESTHVRLDDGEIVEAGIYIINQRPAPKWVKSKTMVEPDGNGQLVWVRDAKSEAA